MEKTNMTVLELREKATAEAEAAQELKDKATQENRGLTSDEADAFDRHLREAERIEQEANRQEHLEKIQARLSEAKPTQAKQELANGEHIEVVSPELFRFGQLRAFKGPDARRNAYAAGKFLMASIMGDARSRQWCRDHNIEMRVQTEGVNTAGGFVVPDAMENAIIDLRETYGAARQNCRPSVMTTDHTVIPRRTGGVTAYFVGETTAITESEKSWNQVELTAKKLGALTRMSTDLGEDSVISIADDLANEMAYAFAVKEDQCLVDGDGTSTYGGMTGIRVKMIDGSHAGSYVSAVTPGDNWSEIDLADLTAVMAALPQYADTNAKWYCSKTCKVAVFDRLIAAAGGVTGREMMEGSRTPMFMGYPVVQMAAMPSDDSSALASVIMLFFGDLSMAATFGTRRGITIKVSDQRYIEYDQIGIQATERFCVNVHDIGAGTGVRGPVVGLYGVV
jgi:HK97 family phage major capsid protein